MAVVGYIAIIGGISLIAVLGIRWTRPRPGERRKTVFDNPGVPSLRDAWKRIDLPGAVPGDPIIPDED